MNKPGFLIAAPASGSGKSMIATGLMAVYAETMRVQSYKVGPDFIDPMYHRAATGHASFNLDPWMLSPEQNRSTYQNNANAADLCVTEGVMGLFDATGANPLENSSAGIAQLLGLPIIFVVDCVRMSGSAAALIHGFHTWCPEIGLAGVICNRVGSAKHEMLLREAIRQTGIPIIGMIPNQKDLVIPARHLGLFTVTEREDAVVEYIEALKPVIRSGIDLALLLQIASTTSAFPEQEPATAGFIPGSGIKSKQDESFQNEPLRISENGAPANETGEAVNHSWDETMVSNPGKSLPGIRPKVRIGIAYDKAFCFYYEANLRLLEEAGAELVFFSPLTAQRLPDNLRLLTFGGGYPELYAQELSANQPLLRSIRDFAGAEHPVYAECGGLVYLTQGIQTADGIFHPLAGLLPGSVRMQKKLVMGYRTIQASRDNWLFPAGQPFKGHEFHYSVWENPQPASAFLEMHSATAATLTENTGYTDGNIIASYIHVHFAQNPLLAQNFVRKALEA